MCSFTCKSLAAGPHRGALLGAVSAGLVGNRADGVPRQGPGKPAGCERQSGCREGKPVGSRLIAQPFTADEYFQPRPSAASPSYNAAASGPSNFAGNNYLLRDRVAQQLGPIVNYAGRPWTRRASRSAPTSKTGSRRTDSAGKPGIVAQWANLHNASAQNWVKNDMTNGKYGLNGTYVAAVAEVAQGRGRCLDQGQSRHARAEARRPGRALLRELLQGPSGHVPQRRGAQDGRRQDRESDRARQGRQRHPSVRFFDLWLREHADADLEPVPADMVMASGSGLDPHITLENAVWQLSNRVAAAWAKKTGGNEQKLHEEIEKLLQEKSALLPGRPGRRAPGERIGGQPGAEGALSAEVRDEG